MRGVTRSDEEWLKYSVLFQLTRLMRGVTSGCCSVQKKLTFQLTRLMRGVTIWTEFQSSTLDISTHTPHARRDPGVHSLQPQSSNFNSHASCEAWQITPLIQLLPLVFQLTRLMRGVTTVAPCGMVSGVFQLTRLMRGVTVVNDYKPDTIYISTHTPHARRDNSFCCVCIVALISTHTPHARRDNEIRFKRCALRKFQLTRLMRGVTRDSWRNLHGTLISTHTPHARRDRCRHEWTPQNWISTHTPHARRDRFAVLFADLVWNFNSHASCEAWLS